MNYKNKMYLDSVQIYIDGDKEENTKGIRLKISSKEEIEERLDFAKELKEIDFEEN